MKLLLPVSLIAMVASSVILVKICEGNHSSAMWIYFMIGILLLFVSAWQPIKQILADIFTWRFYSRALRYIARLMQAIWMFFPGILFLLLTVFCFWISGQGKDIIAAFVNNRGSTPTNGIMAGINFSRITFFLAIGFWVYVSWYSSRVIAYIKKARQLGFIRQLTSADSSNAEKIFTADKDHFEPGEDFLDEMPRIIGNACFLILELAVLQCPVLVHPLSSLMVWVLLLESLFVLYFVNRCIRVLLDKRFKAPCSKVDSFRKWFYIIFIITLALIGLSSLFPLGQSSYSFMIYFLFGLLVLFHLVFIFYINLRRKVVDYKISSYEEPATGNRFIKKLMNYFFIPLKEYGYFKWLLIVNIFGLAIYIVSIWNLSVARMIGPFPIILLGFGILLAFGNIVTAFSMRQRLNFHLLLFVIALVIGQKETHYIHTVNRANNGYSTRPDLKKYLTQWLTERVSDSTKSYDVYFVMANGGASRSGYWTASVLGRLEDSSLHSSNHGRFSDHIFCLSGTSGGGVGVATFFSLLRDKKKNDTALYENSARNYLKHDYFTFTFARLLGPDYFNYIFHNFLLSSSSKDRAEALEYSFEETAANDDNGNSLRVPFDSAFSAFPALDDNGHTALPVLCINTTRMQDGNPGVVTNLKLDSNFNNRIDVVGLLPQSKDISITTGSIMGARFPYLSPAGRIGNSYFVDGGYFDNSGAGVVQEMIQGILDLGKKDPSLAPMVNKLHFKILHIVNSPVIQGSGNIHPIAPIKNDLLSPILTIVGAYDMQTTVNDGRLINFVKNMPLAYSNSAHYIQISLYENAEEWRHDPLNRRFGNEPSYSMNWFISDTTLNRINKRIETNPTLDSLVNRIKK